MRTDVEFLDDTCTSLQIKAISLVGRDTNVSTMEAGLDVNRLTYNHM